MSKTPCCEKMGLKKGPWTAEEDQILTSFVQRYGHGNWRALPKQAGLLRCGKSCRLRWINYLRPDIKRGKFSKEEEDTILKLHGILGNRWSAIATRLSGRTDNEIKNFWHTHLKKRIDQKNEMHNASTSSSYPSQKALIATSSSGPLMTIPLVAASIAPSSIDSTSMECANDGFPSRRNSPSIVLDHGSDNSGETMSNHGSNQISEEMEFWYDVFIKSGQLS